MSRRWILVIIIAGLLFVGLALPALAPEHRGQMEHAADPAADQPAAESADIEAGREIDQTGYVKGFYVSYGALGSEPFRDHARQLLEKTELNAVVLDFKGDRGYLSFPTQVPMAKEIGADRAVALRDPAEFMGWLRDHRVYTIARIVVFKDDLLARAHPEWAVTDSYSGGLWRDGEGLAWADPNYHAVWDYNIALAEEAARMGFDEVQFDYVRFPTDGNIGRALFALENTQERRVAAITGFLRRAKEALGVHKVRLAADVFGYTAWVEDDLGIGQHIEAIAPYLDVLSPMVYPSTYAHGLPGESVAYRNAIAYPYEVVNKSTQRTVSRARAVNPDIEVRPWIQDFRDYAFDRRVYTPDEIRRQMDGAREAGGRGWLLWDPAVKYTVEALVAARPAYPPNPLGGVLVLQYAPANDPEGDDQRSPADLRADLERFLAAGYYPVNLRDLVENGLSAVPAGKRPLVLTFDGSGTDQFRLMPDGTVDRETVVGVLWDFHKSHVADWPLRATFCVQPNGQEPDQGPFGRADLVGQKLALLVAWGLEVGIEFPAGSDPAQMSPEAISRELALAKTRVAAWLPEYHIASLCLPGGRYPADGAVLAQGESDGITYAFRVVAGAAKGLAPSPRSPKFDPSRVPRVPATSAELDRFLKLADRPGTYYVSPGE